MGMHLHNRRFSLLSPRVDGHYFLTVQTCAIEFLTNPFAMCRIHASWYDNYIRKFQSLKYCVLEFSIISGVVYGIVLWD